MAIDLVIMATLLWLKKKPSQSFSYLKNPFNKATLIIWPSRCYGHFILAQKKSPVSHFLILRTPLIWSGFYGPDH